MLSSGPNAATFGWDPMMRLHQITSGSGTTRFGYNGLNRIAEYDGANTLTRRYLHGTGTDEPIVWHEGAGLTDRRFLSADERGSIISVTDSAGTLLGINRYDEYGIPAATNLGRFGYTGQTWLPEVGLWHYKARAYRPDIGRFLQTDPIGYGDGMNTYAYVKNDPPNWVDSLGLCGANQYLVILWGADLTRTQTAGSWLQFIIARTFHASSLRDRAGPDKLAGARVEAEVEVRTSAPFLPAPRLHS